MTGPLTLRLATTTPPVRLVSGHLTEVDHTHGNGLVTAEWEYVPLHLAKFAKVAMKTTGDQGPVPRARQSSGNRSGRTCSGAGPVDSRET